MRGQLFRIGAIAALLCLTLAAQGPTSGPARTDASAGHQTTLQEYCLGCHNSEKARGGLDASNYVKLMEGGSSGAVVKPGDPDDSRL